jgi:hypothetical protein
MTKKKGLTHNLLFTYSILWLCDMVMYLTRIATACLAE